MYTACILTVLAAFAAVEAQKTATHPIEKPVPAVDPIDCSRVQCAFPRCGQGLFAEVVDGNCCPTCEPCPPRPCPMIWCPHMEVPKEDPCACPQCVSTDATSETPATPTTGAPPTKPDSMTTSQITTSDHPTRPNQPTTMNTPGTSTTAVPPTRPGSSDFTFQTTHPTRPNRPTTNMHPTDSRPTSIPTRPNRPTGTKPTEFMYPTKPTTEEFNNIPTKPRPPNPATPDVTEQSIECDIPGQVFMECGTACPAVCGEEQPAFCTLQCVAECQCPKGTMLDKTLAQCVTDCGVPVTASSKPNCSLEPSSGHCKARMRRYYYNVATGLCEVFSYSGCGGNENNFKTFIECQKRCL